MNLKLDKLICFSLNATLCAIANASEFLIVTHHHDLKQLISELCRLGNGINSTSSLKLGKLKLKELFIYSLSASTLTVASLLGLTPFVIDWDAIQQNFGTSSGVKLLAACIYGFSSTYSGILLVSTHLLMFTLVENTERYTNEYLGTQKHLNTGMFRQSRKYFRMFQMVSFIVNSIYSNFLTFFMAVGVAIASVSTFVTLTLWNKLSIVIYIHGVTSSYFLLLYDSCNNNSICKYTTKKCHQIP